VTALDILVAFIITASVVLSMFRGLLKEILSLLAWVCAFLAAGRWGDDLVQWLAGYIASPAARWIAGYSAVFLGTLMVMGLLNLLLSWAIRTAGLGLADRGLGGLFGLARGLLIVLVLAMLARYTPLRQETWWREAWVAPAIDLSLQMIKPLLPDSYAQFIRD
jgi:membrane protein required for colicin V production